MLTLDLESEPDPEGAPEPEPEPATAAAQGAALATRRQPVLTPAPQPSAQRVVSPIRVPSREWGVKASSPSYVGPKTPTDVKIVVGALIVVAMAAAIIIGLLLSNAMIAVIVGVIGLLGIFLFIWMSRL